MVSRIAATLVSALALAPAAQAQEFADWTSLNAGDTVLSGTLLGAPVTVTGGRFHPLSPLDGSSVLFAGADFAPPLPRSDAPELFATSPPASYAIVFGTTVHDPILHFGSLGSVLTFEPGTRLTRRSGQLTVTQNTIQGGLPDVSGTVQLSGDFDRIGFSALWAGASPDGIDFQAGGERVPVVVTPPVAPTPVPTVVVEPPPTPSVPPPLAGVRVTATPRAGAVLIKGPDGVFVALRGPASAPFGATLDTRAGTLDLLSDKGSATLTAGIFRLRQRARQPPEFVLATPAGLERACAPGHTAPPKGIVRTLRVVATKGTFRTVAKKGIVTGKDAAWTTTDGCDGSLVTVQRGSVTVKRGRKALRVRKGERYLLRARLFGAR
jgi:hypothetical protein